MVARRHRVFRAGEIEIDEARRVVRRGAEILRPRTRTFDLIVYLIERRDRIVSQQELLDALWPGTTVTGNSVMQCVNEARRCLDDDSRNPRHIRTVSKAGYQFIGPAEETAAVPVETVDPAGEPPAAPEPVERRKWGPVPVLAGAAVVLAAAVAARIGLSPREASPAAGPVWVESAWWKLDEAAGGRVVDARAGLSAALPGGLRWTRGIQGTAILFPGPELVIRGGDPVGVLPRGRAERTLTAWIQTGSTNADNTVIFQEGEPEPDPRRERFYLALHGTGVAGFGSADMMAGRTRVDDGRWHHLAGVFEGGERGMMRLYVDGAEDAAMPVHLALEPARSVEWSIGRGLAAGTSFRGVIDDVRVFPRALTPAKIAALHRCQSGAEDIVIDGQPHYFTPVMGNHVETIAVEPRASALRNAGKDFGGITFATRRNDCSLGSTASVGMPPDLHIEMELKLSAPRGLVTEAGPFFRSRRAAAGDGIYGGTSAGFAVLLETTGRVLVRRLHPMATLAFSDAPAAAFDPALFHKLETDVLGQSARVWLDGREVVFDEGGSRTKAVKLAPAWETANPPGRNDGGAGIVFGCTRNRGQAGGQEARAIRVRKPGPA